LLGGLAGEHFTDTAAADTIPDGDLAYARLLVSAELPASDFYARAINSKRVGGEVVAHLRRARTNEQEHYRNVSDILSSAGQTPAVAADFEFSYPKGAGPIGTSFPRALTADEASNALDAFTSQEG
jgi:hypothetical protein